MWATRSARSGSAKIRSRRALPRSSNFMTGCPFRSHRPFSGRRRMSDDSEHVKASSLDGTHYASLRSSVEAAARSTSLLVARPPYMGIYAHDRPTGRAGIRVIGMRHTGAVRRRFSTCACADYRRFGQGCGGCSRSRRSGRHRRRLALAVVSMTPVAARARALHCARDTPKLSPIVELSKLFGPLKFGALKFSAANVRRSDELNGIPCMGKQHNR